MTRRLVLLAAIALACTPHRIPGTSVLDTPDNRAIFATIEAYRQAMERLDAAAVMALVAPEYFDDAGTPDPSDDVDRARLAKTLPEDLAKLEAIRIGMTVRRVDTEDDHATAEVLYDGWFRVKTPNGLVPRRESDVHRMKFRRMQGEWKITAGL
jgi:hypothetical protein